MAFETRKYVIIPAVEINNINFSEVLETAPGTCRYSVDSAKTFIKYDGEQPPSVAAISSKSQEYSHEEILAVLSTEEWTSSVQEL
jgi:hypothetical protein